LRTELEEALKTELHTDEALVVFENVKGDWTLGIKLYGGPSSAFMPLASISKDEARQIVQEGKARDLYGDLFK